MRWLLRNLPLLLAAAYFVVVCTLYLARPGFSSEEAYTALTVEDHIQGLLGERYLETWLPPNLNALEGSTLPAVLTVTMGLFGGSVFVFRFIHVLFSLGTLFCVHGVIKRWFDERAAWVTVVLLAVNTSFIRATRFGDQRDEVLQIFLFWLGLWLFQRFVDKRQLGWLYLGGFTWGVALNAKIMALGYFAGVGVAAVFLVGPAWRLLRTTGPIRPVLTTAGAFLLGAAPYIVARLADLRGTLDVTSNTLRGESSAWDNAAFLGNSIQSLGSVLDMLRGQMAADLLVTLYNPYYPFLVAAALVGSALVFVLTRHRRELRLWLCVIVCYGVLLTTTNLRPSRAPDAFYVLMLLPAAEVFVGLFVSQLFSVIRNRIAATVLAVALVVPTVAAEIAIAADYLHQIRADRIIEEYDPVIYEVFDTLEADGITEVYSLTQFIGYNLVYLSDREMRLPITGDWPKVKVAVEVEGGQDDEEQVQGEDMWTAVAWAGDDGIIRQADAFHHHFTSLEPARREKVRILVQRSRAPDGQTVYAEEFGSLAAALRVDGYRLDQLHRFGSEDHAIEYSMYAIRPRDSAPSMEGGEVVETSPDQ